VLFAWSIQALEESSFVPEAKLRALHKLCQIAEETQAGQILDGFSEMESEVREETVYAVQDLKTARYTVAGPLQLGAILAGGGAEEMDFIFRISRPLGIAYQIQDDILGVFGETEATGKPVGADLREGKKTLLVAYALKHAAPLDREFLESRLGKEDLGEEEVREIREIMRRTGSFDYSQRRIQELIEEFKEVVENGGEKIGNRYAPLRDLADHLLKRRG
jgi:geranylgeranyl diphosphate synthase type I